MVLIDLRIWMSGKAFFYKLFVFEVSVYYTNPVNKVNIIVIIIYIIINKIFT